MANQNNIFPSASDKRLNWSSTPNSRLKMRARVLRESPVRSFKSSWVNRLPQVSSDSTCCFAVWNRCHRKRRQNNSSNSCRGNSTARGFQRIGIHIQAAPAKEPIYSFPSLALTIAVTLSERFPSADLLSKPLSSCQRRISGFVKLCLLSLTTCCQGSKNQSLGIDPARYEKIAF